jgi:hypothetical protein
MATAAQYQQMLKKKNATIASLKKKAGAGCPGTSAASIAANQWPGMTKDTSAQFTRVGRGLPISRPNQFAQVHQRLYHVLDYATGGATQLNFFAANMAQHVCNVNNGMLPDERPFWLTGVCVTFQDATAAGVRSGNQLNAAAITSLARAEEVRTILQCGLLSLSVADREILHVQDLTHFPSDGGYHVSAAAVSYASATAGSVATGNNGEPIAGNRFRLPQPYAILPGKIISCKLLWQSALSITTAGRIKVELVGESIMPLNG